jgi:hypothetical protein
MLDRQVAVIRQAPANEDRFFDRAKATASPSRGPARMRSDAAARWPDRSSTVIDSSPPSTARSWGRATRRAVSPAAAGSAR